jgi:hypothetical protein
MTPAEFEQRWATLALATAGQHPDADLEDWLFHEARGLVATVSDPDQANGRIEWIA